MANLVGSPIPPRENRPNHFFFFFFFFLFFFETKEEVNFDSMKKIKYSAQKEPTTDPIHANSLEAIRVCLFLTNKSGVLIGV
jgi:hypothetical protein